ncbi:transcriptional regulator with XRE-family HTH domain [Leucobacter exalbidus]|uniref:Transcriptional regulator with XRE-family HTH domain n=1 Tax=Leucobacter exalbidus TaxID=662960 RepID=A0A940T600_9MICO|nr:XRE family transcriptional regulator [Leucobacter exalbidus]MBP1326491.1 transcriptional regulator with XRE-family HTH domain [Leucobacter exalbidus]
MGTIDSRPTSNATPSEQVKLIGGRLRRAREDRGLTIPETAAYTGLTKGFISQVELGRTSASIASLASICDALNLPMASLFEPPAVYKVASDARESTKFPGRDVSDTVLTPPGLGGMQIIETIIQPGGGSDPKPYRLPFDQEFVTVLEGVLHMTIEGSQIELLTGDSLTFRASLPHTWWNPSEEQETRVMWVLTQLAP